jgi:hypothetical protein
MSECRKSGLRPISKRRCCVDSFWALMKGLGQDEVLRQKSARVPHPLRFHERGDLIRAHFAKMIIQRCGCEIAFTQVMYIIPSFPEGSAPRYGASQWRNSRPPPAAQKAPCRGIRKWLNPNAGEIAPAVARPVYLLSRTQPSVGCGGIPIPGSARGIPRPSPVPRPAAKQPARATVQKYNR